MNKPNLKTVETIIKVAVVVAIFMVASIFGTYQWTRASFQGAQESLPFYMGAPQPYSYVIDMNGTHCFAYNGTTGFLEQTSTNASQIFINTYGNMSSGGTVCLENGKYPIDSPVLLGYSMITTIAQSYGGAEIQFGINGKFFLNSSSLLDWDVFIGIFFNGTNTATRGIDAGSMPSGVRVQNLNIYKCTFKNWGAPGAIPIYVKNPELLKIEGNYIATWTDVTSWTNATFILLDTDDYNAGNVWIANNEFNMQVDYSWLIEVQSLTGGKTFENIHAYNNHYYTGNSSKVSIYAWVFNLTGGGGIRGFRSIDDRTESVNLLTALETGATLIDLEVEGGEFDCSQSTVAYDFIRVTSQIRGANIHDNHFVSGSDSSVIEDANTNAPYTTIHDNTFRGTNVANITTVWSTLIWKNQGYNPLGYIATPITTSFLRDSGTGTIMANTTYAASHSPKNIYLYGGTIINVTLNQQIIFTTTACMFHVDARDTFTIYWEQSTPPTIRVFGE